MQIIVRDLDLLSPADKEALRYAKEHVLGADAVVQINTPRSADPEDYITVGVHGMPGCTVTVPGCDAPSVIAAIEAVTRKDPRRKLWIDIETRSAVELKSAANGDGTVYRYAEDETFEILLAAYAVDDGKVRPLVGHDNIVERLAPALLSNDVVKYAHNAQFERVCFSYALRRAGLLGEDEFLDPEAWEDTMAHNMTHGLPGSLKRGAKALGAEEKDEAGTRLINLFCKPRKDGTFLPVDESSEEWKAFVAYCIQDVETMRDMSNRLLAKYGRLWWTDLEREVWAEDQRINDRGVRLNLDLAEAGAKRDVELKAEAKRRITELTGIENPNSTPQWKAWLKETGLDLELSDLQKGTINERISSGALDDRPEYKEALQLKLVATSKSASKFAAALAGVSKDGRYRGAFKFHQAHTGRWSGKGLQLHNLNHDKFHDGDEDNAFDINLRMTQEAVERVLKGEPVTGKELGMLVRPMMLGPFSIADYTGIEALMTGWLSGEQWVVDTFARKEDIYVATGKQAGGLSRKEGKVMVLACLEGSTPVLTESGEKPIVDVRAGERVWDGQAWVRSDGAVFRGEKEVMFYDGLWATPDHKVWIAGRLNPVPFGIAAAARAPLAVSAAGGSPVRRRRRVRSGRPLPTGLVRTLRTSRVPAVRAAVLGGEGEHRAGAGVDMRGVRPATQHGPSVAVEAHAGREGSLLVAAQSAVPALRRARRGVSLLRRGGGRRMDRRALRAAGIQGAGDRSRGQRRALRAWESAVGFAKPADGELTAREARALPARHLRSGGRAVRVQHGAAAHVRRDVKVGYRGTRRAPQRMAPYTRTARVYDVLNAGPRNRFTAGGKLVHNCGYSGGTGAMRRFPYKACIPEEEMRAAFEEQIEQGARLPNGDGTARALSEGDWPAVYATWEEQVLQGLIDAWRGSNKHTVAFWDRLTMAVKHGGVAGEHVWVTKNGSERVVHLPSGRCLVYHNVGMGQYPVNIGSSANPEIIWKAGLHRIPDGAAFGLSMWRGLLTENVVQAVARDFLAAALVRLAKAGLRVVSHVHDEVLIEDSDASLTDTLASLMAAPVAWAPNLPLDAGAYTCPIYVKD